MRFSLKVILWTIFILNSGWGFFSHQMINRLAVFTLPPEMIAFYKKNIQYITETATNPDRRRYAVAEEGPRHFIDIEEYGDSVWTCLPENWQEAVLKYGEDSLKSHGILPWHMVQMFNRLKAAFMVQDPEKILRTAAELGHYVADAHVPLHTSHNYNGQLTGQNGIHAFWESRLPELYFNTYDFYVGKAAYLTNPKKNIWETIHRSHALVDSVLSIEKKLTEQNGSKYSYETKGKQTIKVYSVSFSGQYHERLSGMVERQLRASVKLTGDLWYTAWIDAGQPDLKLLIDYHPTETEIKMREDSIRKWKERNYKSREHESDFEAQLW